MERERKNEKKTQKILWEIIHTNCPAYFPAARKRKRRRRKESGKLPTGEGGGCRKFLPGAFEREEARAAFRASFTHTERTARQHQQRLAVAVVIEDALAYTRSYSLHDLLMRSAALPPSPLFAPHFAASFLTLRYKKRTPKAKLSLTAALKSPSSSSSLSFFLSALSETRTLVMNCFLLHRKTAAEKEKKEEVEENEEAVGEGGKRRERPTFGPK